MQTLVQPFRVVRSSLQFGSLRKESLDFEEASSVHPARDVCLGIVLIKTIVYTLVYTTLDISHVWFRTRPRMCAKPHPKGVRCNECGKRASFNAAVLIRGRTAVLHNTLYIHTHKIVYDAFVCCNTRLNRVCVCVSVLQNKCLMTN